MTVTAEPAPQVSAEEIEEIARAVESVSDTVRLEWINGRIGFKGTGDGDHGEIIRWLQEHCIRSGTELWLYAGGDLGLRLDGYREGRAKPDAVLAPRGSFAGQADWAQPDHVAMVVEVTSFDSDTHRRDRRDKPHAYARAGVPVYLLIDRQFGTLTVYSDPSPERYRHTHTVKFGEAVTLPDPVGIELDTDELKNYVR